MSAATPRSVAIDALRAGAAGLVLLSHGRALLIRDAVDGGAPSWPAAAFLAVSGLGHQAVIVFFVISGLVVTEAMGRLHVAGRWSLGRFGMARLVRLWIVLVPCLVLGAALDRCGLALAEPGMPYGIPPLNGAPVTPALDLGTMTGNLAFLQTVAVPVLGSNGPLWSLANEFWYYVVAALAFSAWLARPCPTRAAAPAVAAVLVLALLPAPMIALAPVWAFGAIVAVLRRHRPIRRRSLGRSVGLVGLAGATMLLVLVRLHRGPEPLLADLALGAAVAAFVLGLPVRTGVPTGWAAAAVRRAAAGSYSLYLSHLPVLSMLAVLTIGPERLPLGRPAILLLGLHLATALLAASALWWAFERHTSRVQAWIATRTVQVTGLALPEAP